MQYTRHKDVEPLALSYQSSMTDRPAVTMYAQFIIWNVFHRKTPWGYVINIGKKCGLEYIDYCVQLSGTLCQTNVQKLNELRSKRLKIHVKNYNHGQNIWEKLKFSCEIVHYGKCWISIFKESFASIDNWALGYNSTKFRHYSQLS